MNLKELIKTREKSYLLSEFNYDRVIDQETGKSPQRELVESIKLRRNNTRFPKYQMLLYRGGNGAGKTAIGANITASLAVGEDCEKYNIPYIGTAKHIMIGTKSGVNVKAVIEPYLLGENSITRIPPELIHKHGIKRDNGILKSIKLTKGCNINILTYDQGYERWQGQNPDFIWMDEEPTDPKVFLEATARTRIKSTQLLITMTPLSGITSVSEYFDDFAPEHSIKFQVNSTSNTTITTDFAAGMSPEERRMRIEGIPIPPTGLVYREFNSFHHVVEVEPEELGNVENYRSIDFGVDHPTGVLFISVDEDENILVWDEICMRNTLLSELVKEIREKTGEREIEYTVADSAGARERLELKHLGIATKAANKRKRENEMSNRRAGILKVNGLFHNHKLFIHDRCTNLIKELSTHFYKEGTRDGEVHKENDDLLDALRYFIFSYKKPNNKTTKELFFEKKYGKGIGEELIHNNNVY